MLLWVIYFAADKADEQYRCYTAQRKKNWISCTSLKGHHIKMVQIKFTETNYAHTNLLR